MFKKYRILFFPLCFIASIACGQWTVTGKVVDDETQKAVADALVEVVNTDIKTKTNFGGYFQVSVDSSLHNHLLISSTGYESIEVRVLTEKFKVALRKPVSRKNILTIADSISLITDLHRNIRYPSSARARRLQGRVYVAFQVAPTGEITNVRVLKDEDEIFGKTLIETFKKIRPLSLSQQTRDFILAVQFKYQGESAKQLPALGTDVELPEGRLLEEMVLVGYHELRKVN